MVIRCGWTHNGSKKLLAYHDQEWGIAEHDDQKLFELLSLESYQAGLSWQTVLNKREAFRAVFFNYDIKRVAKMSAEDIDKILTNPQIIRHRLKLAATVNNAQAILNLWEQGITLDQFLWKSVEFKTIDHQVQGYNQLDSKTPASIALAKNLKHAGFKFMGPVTVYSLMQAAGLVNDHEVKWQYHG